MGKRLTRGVLAAALAVVLLSGTGATMAAWSDGVELPGVTITAGRLTLEETATSVVVQRRGTDGQVRALEAGAAVVPGDIVRLTSQVTVRAQGDALRARLVLDRSGLGLTHAGVRFPVTEPVVTTDLTAAGRDAWTVTAADDGTTVTATVDLTIPRTTDGRESAANRSNWWGQRLQRETLHPGTFRWTLAQETA